MKLNQLRLKANEKGFTLIELMIVIAIIGILAAVAIPNFISYRDKSYCSAAERDANSLMGAVSNYFAIPSNTSWTNVTLASGFAGGKQSGVDWPKLSGTNSAVIRGPVNNITSVVTDGSGRCPADYRGSQQAAGWSNGTATPAIFKKEMK
jgi:type IV pilus assembly protein PilA